jgi:DNA-binding PadR family transcriptional regulator
MRQPGDYYYAERSIFVEMTDARLLVLVSLSDGPKHGYAIQTDIEGFAGVHLGPGTLYGALSSLERDELVEALPNDQRRQPYRLTADGRQRLREQLDELDRIRRRAVTAAT